MDGPVQTAVQIADPTSAADMKVWAYGLAGAATRVFFILKTGQKANMWEIAGVLTSGIVCAGTGASMAATFIPGAGAFSVGFAAYAMGIVGQMVAEWLMKLTGSPKDSQP